MYCRDCGEKLKNDSKYCSACGKETEDNSSSAKIEAESDDRADRYTTDDAIDGMDRTVQTWAYFLTRRSKRATITGFSGLMIILSVFFTYQQASALGFEIQRTGLQLGDDAYVLITLGILITILAIYRWNSRTASFCILLGLGSLSTFFYYFGGYNFLDEEARTLVQPGFGLYLLGISSITVVILSSHKAINGFRQYVGEYRKEPTAD